MTSSTIIIGIDPGSRVTGYGVIEKKGSTLIHIDNGIIRSKSENLLQRLTTIYADLNRLIEAFKPTKAAIEDIFVAKHARSALTLGHARGVAMLAIANADIPLGTYPPRQVKQAVTGNGAAEKSQVQEMVRMLLKLPETAAEDASDALAVAICHANTINFAKDVA